jgi:hypothetical protein
LLYPAELSGHGLKIQLWFLIQFRLKSRPDLRKTIQDAARSVRWSNFKEAYSDVLSYRDIIKNKINTPLENPVLTSERKIKMQLGQYAEAISRKHIQPC